MSSITFLSETQNELKFHFKYSSCPELLNFTRTVHLNAVFAISKQKKKQQNLYIYRISHNLIST